MLLLLFIFLQRKKLNNIVLPFTIGLLISYILNPLVVFLVNKGVNRTVAVTLIYFILIGSIIVALVYIVPLTLIELNKLISAIPFFTEEVQQMVGNIRERYKDILPLAIQETIDTNIKHMERNALNLIQRFIDRIITLLSAYLA